MLISVLNIKLTCEWHKAIKLNHKNTRTHVIVVLRVPSTIHENAQRWCNMAEGSTRAVLWLAWAELPSYDTTLKDCIYYTGCPRRNVPDFRRVFLMLKYTDITQKTYVQSWTVTVIMAREKSGLLAGPHTVPVGWQSYPFPSLSVVSYDGNSAHASHRTARVLPSAMLHHRWAFSCIVLGTLRTTMTWVRVFLWFNLMALCHSQVSLMLSTDINITETTYSCQF